jgi:phosphoribosylglycinamide formyltransferase-1
VSDTLRLGVLASGVGRNLQAILDKIHAPGVAQVVAVATDNPAAIAIARAQAAGIPDGVFPFDRYPDRHAHDMAMADWLEAHGVELVVLAGYMRLVVPEFLARFPRAVVNVHPALLPAFPGIDAVEHALEYGVKVFGVTVHFVDDGVDTGPVILQRAVELPDARTVEEVTAAIFPLETELLPEAIGLIAAGAVVFDPENPRRVSVDRSRSVSSKQ